MTHFHHPDDVWMSHSFKHVTFASERGYRVGLVLSCNLKRELLARLPITACNDDSEGASTDNTYYII